jgi:hypothetical protein
MKHFTKTTAPLVIGFACALLAVVCAGSRAQTAPGQPFVPGIAPYDPPPGVVPYFPTSPFLQKIPNPPTVNPNSAAWVASLGTFSLNHIDAATDAAILRNHGQPVYFNHAGANIPVRIHCTEHYGHIPCNTEGMTVYIDPRELPENGDAPGQDDHFALIDPVEGYEYDFWEVTWPPSDGVLVAHWAGRCALSGNGFTNPSYAGKRWNAGCVSTASGTPLSMGLIRARDMLAAIASGGTLPEAIAVGIRCPGPGPLPPPFLGSGDGKCPGHPPEGSHLYLAMHDADVNALGVAPIVAVILRTLDEDHYGAYIIDTGGNHDGIELGVQADTTYTVWGASGPLLTQYVPEAAREGLPGATTLYRGRYDIPLPIPPSVGAAVRFL